MRLNEKRGRDKALVPTFLGRYALFLVVLPQARGALLHSDLLATIPEWNEELTSQLARQLTSKQADEAMELVSALGYSQHSSNNER